MYCKGSYFRSLAEVVGGNFCCILQIICLIPDIGVGVAGLKSDLYIDTLRSFLQKEVQQIFIFIN